MINKFTSRWFLLFSLSGNGLPPDICMSHPPIKHKHCSTFNEVTLKWSFNCLLYLKQQPPPTCCCCLPQQHATPWTAVHHAPVIGFPRQEYWSDLPFPSPGDPSWPRDGTRVSCIDWQADSLPLSHQGGPSLLLVTIKCQPQIISFPGLFLPSQISVPWKQGFSSLVNKLSH